MRIALLTTDNREHHRRYDVATPYFGPAIEALLEGFRDLQKIDVHVLACTQTPMAAPESLGRNIRFHLLDVPKIGWLRTGYQGCVRAIRRRLRDIAPDLVHGQGSERECALAAAFSGFPNVVTIHGNMRAIARAQHARAASFLWMAARLEHVALARTHGVFCNSQYTESQVAPLAQRIWRVPNAVRAAFFQSVRTRPDVRPEPLLLNIGTIIGYKRQLELLEMCAGLRDLGHRFQLHFVGAASERDDYGAQFLKRMRDQEYSAFASHTPALELSELIHLLDSANALVHVPSEESFGLVAAEALARNLKFFGSSTGGVAEIARDADGAEIFPTDDWEGLASSITSWLPHAHEQRPTSATSLMLERYAPSVIAQRHLRIYTELLQRR